MRPQENMNYVSVYKNKLIKSNDRYMAYFPEIQALISIEPQGEYFHVRKWKDDSTLLNDGLYLSCDGEWVFSRSFEKYRGEFEFDFEEALRAISRYLRAIA